jgi:hypothetical protein
MGTGVAVVVIGILALFLGGGSGGGTTVDPNKPGPKLPPKDGPVKPPVKPPVGPPKPPGGGGKVVPPHKGRGFGGGKWGTGAVPASFNPNGNLLWISPDCDTVAEGAWFMPTLVQAITGNNIDTMDAHLALRSPPGSSDPRAQNGIYGFIDYLINDQGYEQPEDVTARIFSEASPMCAAVDPSQWGPALAEWYQEFAGRVAEYVESEMTGIPFGPDNEE